MIPGASVAYNKMYLLTWTYQTQMLGLKGTFLEEVASKLKAKLKLKQMNKGKRGMHLQA